jgi:hypothetical protein
MTLFFSTEQKTVSDTTKQKKNNNNICGHLLQGFSD